MQDFQWISLKIQWFKLLVHGFLYFHTMSCVSVATLGCHELQNWWLYGHGLAELDYRCLTIIWVTLVCKVSIGFHWKCHGSVCVCPVVFLLIHNIIWKSCINGTRTKSECAGARAEGKVSGLIGQGQWFECQMARGQGSDVKVWGGQGLVRDQVSVVMDEAWWVGRPSGWHRPMAKESWVRMARVRAPCLVLNLAWDIAKTIAKAYGNIRCAKKRWSHVKLGKSNPNTYPWGPPGQEIPRKCKVSEFRVRKHKQNHRKTLYFQRGCMSGSS